MNINKPYDAMSIVPALIPGVTWNVTIAKSLTGAQPPAFFPSDSVDLTAIQRYDQFFAYLSLEYINNSGFALTDAQITIQLPIAGEPNYYEPYTPGAPPAGWVTYPNTPTGDGNIDFPTGTLTMNSSTRLITWTSVRPINNGASGIIFVKIPMRDPYTCLGAYEYEAILHTAQGENEGSAEFTVNGVQDELPYDIERQTDLGFYPEAPDADQYYYHRYFYTTSYNPNYIMPPRAHEHDQSFVNSPEILVTLPPGAEVVSTGNATTTSPGKIHISAYQARNTYFVVRYPKSIYPDPDTIISLEAVAVGRYVAQALVNVEIPSTAQSFQHAVGAPTNIPAPSLGDIRLSAQPSVQYSHEGFMLGSQPISRGAYTFRRRLDSIIAEEVYISFQNVDFVQDGVSTTSNYGYNMIYLEQFYWSGASNPLNPVLLTITALYDDSSSEILTTLTEEEILALGGFSLYPGNVPGKRMAFDPPVGKVVKKIIFSIKNVPAGMYCRFYLNGFIADYPAGGADSIRQHYSKFVYGYDTGSGRPIGDLSGNFYIERPVLRDTLLQPNFTVTRTTGSAVNPGGLDTIRLSSFFTENRYNTYLNPEFALLLPAGYSYEGFVDITTEYTGTAVYNVYDLPDGRLLDTPPTVTSMQDFNGTGRTLVKIQYYGLLQPCEILGVDITVRAAPSIAIGTHVMNGYFWAQNPDFENILDGTLTPIVPNTYDVMENGDTDALLFGRDLTVTISRGVGTLLYTTMKGSLDPALTSMATTKQGTVIEGNLTMDYNGITPMQGIQLVTILPYEGDPSGSMWGPPVEDQRMTLAAPVDISAYPGATVYYNLTPTDDPLAAGWTTTYSAAAASVRIDMPPTLELISGGIERIDIPLLLQMPGTATIADLPSVLGTGVLPVKGYDATEVLPETGLEGDTSSIKSIALSLDVFVFHDVNGNGSYDGGDFPYSNVLVQVFNGNDDPETAIPIYIGYTNINGEISFVDGFGGVTLDFTSYKIRVVSPAVDTVFTQGPDVTVDESGIEVVTLTSTNPSASIVAGIQNAVFSLNGRYWINMINPANGEFNPGDLPYAGAIIRLFNITINKYSNYTAITDANGYFEFPMLPKGPLYRVVFPLTSDQHVSPIAAGGNMLTESGTGVGIYTFESGIIVGDTFTVNGAVYENGNIQVLFMYGTTVVGASEILVRQLETTYTAYIGAVEDTTPLDYGIFVVPQGYRLVAGEPTNKTATIDYDNKTAEIIFYVERIGGRARILKVDAETGQPLEGGVFTGESGINYITDEDGYAVLGLIPPGIYPFTETQPPVGYDPNPAQYEIIVEENPDGTVNFYITVDGGFPIQIMMDSDGYYTIVILNHRGIIDDSVALRLYKYDAQNPALGLVGAVFTDPMLGSFTTDAFGYAYLGEYQTVEMQLVETVTPVGYEPNTNIYGLTVIFNTDQTFTVLANVNSGTPIELELDADGFYTLPVANDPIIPPPESADITLRKVDADDENIGLGGAQFRDQYGNVYTTDANGYVLLGSFVEGTELELVETFPPEGYELNQIEYRLVVIPSGDGLAVEVYENGILTEILQPTGDNQFLFVVPDIKKIIPPMEAEIILRKVDAENENIGLGGAQFRDQYGNVFTTDANGNVLLGVYDVGATIELVETVPPEGYELNTTVYNLVIIPSGYGLAIEVYENGVRMQILYPTADNQFTFVVPDTKKTAPSDTTVILRKVDAENENIGLGGAQFRDQYGNIYTTDANGNVPLGLLEIGASLELTEITTPEGYELNPIIYTLTVIQSGYGIAVQVYENGLPMRVLYPSEGNIVTFVVPNTKAAPPCPPCLPPCCKCCCNPCHF